MLYIMRHGKTDWNSSHKLQGRTDIPLNDEGRLMAKNACREYKNVNIDICFCSPLKRATETARLVLEGRNIPIIKDNRLVEMSFGKYEGMENVFLTPECPIRVLFDTPEKYTSSLGGSETFDELFSRTGDFLENTVKPLLKEGKDVLIIGHGAMNSSIICQVKNIPVKDFWSAGLEQCRLMPL